MRVVLCYVHHLASCVLMSGMRGAQERQKRANRKKKKRDRIPRNAQAVLYCEREEKGVQRFFELRLSGDGRSVYARRGRVDKCVCVCVCVCVLRTRVF